MTKVFFNLVLEAVIAVTIRDCIQLGCLTNEFIDPQPNKDARPQEIKIRL